MFDIRKKANATQNIESPYKKPSGILPGNNLDIVDNVTQFTKIAQG
jgi:hypothetical protein